MPKAKSLADELAELSNPAPEADPDEDDILGSGPALLESEDEEQDKSRPSRRAKEKSLRMRGEIELDAKVYSGKKSSRKEVFGSDVDDEDEDSGLSEGGEGGGGSEGEDGSEMDGDSSDGLRDGEDDAMGSGDDEPEDDGGDADDNDEGEEAAEMDVFKAFGGPSTAEEKELEEEYEELRQGDEGIQAAVAERHAADLAKGKAVDAQQRLGKAFVEHRILLQQVLEGSNKLLLPDEMEAAASSSDSVMSAMQTLADSATETLDVLLELQGSMMSGNPAIEEASGRDSAAAGTSGEPWDRIQHLWDVSLPYIDASVDRWHRKTLLGSGGAALRSKLKALSQSPSQHIASMLREPARLLARTRVPTASVRRVGVPDESDNPPGPAQELEDDADELDEETFDDSDFYQVLLKEFLEGEVSAGGHTSASGKLKRKRAVDTRASKGRKMRYDIHEKVVNFMVPEEISMPTFATQVFSNLFGRKAGPSA